MQTISMSSNIPKWSKNHAHFRKSPHRREMKNSNPILVLSIAFRTITTMNIVNAFRQTEVCDNSQWVHRSQEASEVLFHNSGQ